MKTDEARTRDRVARVILESGPQTAAVIAEHLGLTAAGVRRHLDSLIEAGLLLARDPYPRTAIDSRRRGRPAKVFVLTEAGRERFEQAYDDLAISALRHLQARLGSQAIAEFADARAAEFMRRHPIEAGADRLHVVADALTEEGYAASVQAVGQGHELCQHHCPVAHVATVFPQICEAETAALSTMLGTHVQRLATIAHGDGVCTTFVPDPSLIRKSRNQRDTTQRERRA